MATHLATKGGYVTSVPNSEPDLSTGDVQISQEIAPFVMVPHWIIESGASANALRVYLVLGTYASGPGGSCYPSRQTIADQAGMSVETLKRTMRELRGIGAVATEVRKRAAGKQTSNLYRLAFNAPFPVSRDQESRGVTHDPLTKTTTNKNQGTTPAGGTVADAPGGDGELFEVDRPAEIPNAGALVKAWCEGFSETREGKTPDDSVVRRVAGSARQIAKTRTDMESWRTAWHAAKDAGRMGRFDIVAHLADFQPPARKMHHERINEELQETARRMSERRPAPAAPALPAAPAQPAPHVVATDSNTYQQARAQMRAAN